MNKQERSIQNKPNSPGANANGSVGKSEGGELVSLLCWPAMLIGFLCALISLLSLLPIAIGEAASNMRTQLAVLTLFSMIPPLFADARWRILSFVLLPVLVLNLFFLIPSLSDKGARTTSVNLAELRFKLLELVLDKDAGDLEKLQKLLEEENADLITLQRVDNKWMEKLKPLAEKLSYPNISMHPRDNGFGMAVLSKYPLTDEKLSTLGKNKIPLFDAKVKFDFGPVRLLVVSLPGQFSKEGFEGRATALDALAGKLSASRERIILAGCFDAAPYSVKLGGFISQAKLHDIRDAWFVKPNCFLPEVSGLDLWINRFPFDHILVNEHLSTHSSKIGASIGAFRRPLIAELYPASVEEVTVETAPIKTEIDSPNSD